MTAVRRTSFALGGTTRITMMAGENDAHFLANRENLRQKLQDELIGGGLSALFARLDPKRTGEITYAQFTSACDQNGWSVMHQDAKGLMKQIDTNKNGKISYQELKKFVVGFVSSFLDSTPVLIFHHSSFAANIACRLPERKREIAGRSKQVCGQACSSHTV